MGLVAAVCNFFVRAGEKQQALERRQNAAIYGHSASEASPFVAAATATRTDDGGQLSPNATGSESREVTPQRVAKSQEQAQLALRRLKTSRRQEKQLQKQLTTHSRQIAWLGAKVRWRKQLASGFPPAGWLVISSSLGLGLGIVPGLVLLSSVTSALILGAIGLIAGIGAPIYLFYISETQDLITSQNTAQRTLQADRNKFAQAQQQTTKLEQQYNSARAIHHELADALQDQRERERLASRTHRLAMTPWQSLSGIPFEEFLAEVLREHGYQVDLTTASNDQGVDLIAAAGDQRIAIQAKGYPSGGSIGNDAVLKVVGGMRIYDCNMSAVVTNSRYTRQAKTAAAKSDCYLIDRESIPRMIRGQFPWG